MTIFNRLLGNCSVALTVLKRHIIATCHCEEHRDQPNDSNCRLWYKHGIRPRRSELYYRTIGSRKEGINLVSSIDGYVPVFATDGSFWQQGLP
jgi:hypothetical protein